MVTVKQNEDKQNTKKKKLAVFLEMRVAGRKNTNSLL
jgi:hypothetical protein